MSISSHILVSHAYFTTISFMGFSKQIEDLLRLRKRVGVNAGSKIHINAAEADIYVANIDDRLVVKLGPRFHMGALFPDPSNWKLALSGKDFAIWESTRIRDTNIREDPKEEVKVDLPNSGLHMLRSISSQIKRKNVL
ncbi:hypothetical protein KP509_1Z278000 [Ceratopteris richardii]|nr:hypothetical protein KP509_1Z278000 [Ceratopteris richardii]